MGKPGNESGVALLITLTILSLTLTLMLTMLSTGITERTASSVYKDGIYAESLANQAVNLSIGQIRQATSNQDRLWVSQPGAIRTYDESGKFATGYKLYSDERMSIGKDEMAFTFDDAFEMTRWDSHPERFVDLNSPYIRGRHAFFPIVNPEAATVQGVEGFEIMDGQVPVGPMANALGKIGKQSLPMPVKWLYVLKDGTVGSLNEDNEFVVYTTDKSGEGQEVGGLASEANPISGRMAFWTDDETAKVNINTASEPTFWDTPRAAARGPGRIAVLAVKEFDDRAYGWSQPARLEFQRFPGHPAQTALSPILFPGVAKVTDPMKQAIYSAAPKIIWGGSKAGTVSFNDIPEQERLDRAHLYPSVDEYLLKANRQINNFASVSESGESPEVMLERSRFFLTANSRAPEVNAFNLPRISIWPTHEEEETDAGEHWTIYDKLIRHCASTGPQEERDLYFFQRANSESSVHDWDEIERNQDLFRYLQRLAGKKIPGYGGTFKTKFEEDTDQVLTEIFDYIRCVNLYDDLLPKIDYEEEEWLEDGLMSQFTGPRYANSNEDLIGAFPGHGQVVPIQIEEFNTKGFGRSHTVSEAGIMFICNADAGGPSEGDPGLPKHPNGVLGSNVLGTARGQNKGLPRKLEWEAGKEERCIQAALLFELFSPSQGWTPLNDDLTMKVEILDNFRVDSETIDFAIDDDVWYSTGDCHRGNDPKKKGGGRVGFLSEGANSAGWGGTTGFWQLMKRRLAPERGDISPDGGRVGIEGNEKNRSDERRKVYPYISVPFVVKGNDETMSFGGGKIRVTLYGGTNHSRKPVDIDERPVIQTMELEFPAATIPVPILARHRGPVRSGNPPSNPDGRNRFSRDVSYDRNGNPRRSASGVHHPSYWWILNNAGPGVGDPQHGHGNYGRWGIRGRDDDDPAGNGSAHRQDFSAYQRGRLSLFGQRGGLDMIFIQSKGRDYNVERGADVVRTIVPKYGDYRLLAGKKELDDEDFVPHRHYHDEERYLVHHFSGVNSDKFQREGFDKEARPLVRQMIPDLGFAYHPSKVPDFPETDDSLGSQMFGDFDNGVANAVDGAYINKPDEGNGWVRKKKQLSLWVDTIPYFEDQTRQEALGAANFSPNRQIASPVMLGSLSTGVKRDRPWETLLFRPQIEHPGSAKPAIGENIGSIHPPDHALLDWFWMPVVEPYAISEPFSTAGKINLNYAMLPFSHIKRSTGIRAVMESEELLHISNKAGWFYKRGKIPHDKWDLRRPINMDETLRQFDDRFSEGRVFKTPGEICEIHLVPAPKEEVVFLEDMEDGSFWRNHALTGDNTRERPYANIYPRLTTKSNTYRVHFRAQTIKQGRGSLPGSFEPEFDTTAAEYRGSALVERYLDPADPNIPDFAKEADTELKLADFYKYRILSMRRFAP